MSSMSLTTHAAGLTLSVTSASTKLVSIEDPCCK